MNKESQCAACHGLLKRWAELDEDEREVVRRLPGAREYSSAERERNHFWCTRCWYECALPVSEA